MLIPKNPKPIAISIEFAVHEMTDLNIIDQHIEEYSRLGWTLEERGHTVDPMGDLYTHKAYIKMTRR